MQQRQQIFVEHLPLAIRQRGELVVQLGEGRLVELVSELLIAPLQRVPAGVLTEHQRGARHADLLRSDDLVRQAVLQQAVLVDARFVRECIAAHDRLVRLGEDADDVGQELAGAEDLLRVHTALECHGVRAHPTRHHDLLECGVAGAFPDAVDRALHLAGAGLDGGERVGDREAQVVVTMGAEHHLIAVRHAATHRAEHRAVFGGQRVAHGIGQVDRPGPRRDRGLDHAAQEVQVGARGVLGRELDVVGVAPGATDRRLGASEAVGAADLKLVLEVEVRRGDEDVHPRSRGRPQRLPGEIDVAVVAPRQRRHRGPSHGFGHAADGLLIALGRAREPGFDDVHAQGVELEGEAQLRLRRHGIAWRLLAIPQRGVEDADVSLHGDRSVPFRTVR